MALCCSCLPRKGLGVKLCDDIMTYYEEFQKSNINNNMWAMQVAQYTYNNCVSSAWGPQSCCFHPRGLEKLHKEGKELALEQFLKERVESENDDFKDKLIEILEKRYRELQNINEFNNVQAVSLAFGEYTRRMDKHSQPALSSFLVAPFIIKVFALLPRYHDSSRRKALSIFDDRRRGPVYDDDQYLDDLKEKIDTAFENYKDPLRALIRELGLHHMLPPGTV